jgi:hypothetical protein
MSVEHTARTGKTYYLHERVSQAGKLSYFFLMNADGQLAAAIPDGYEVYENVGGQVFLRKRTAQIIRSEELLVVETALRQHGEPWQYRAETKKNAIVVYEAGDMGGLDSMARVWGRSLLPDDMKRRHATYMAVLRFTLADKKTRAFVTERFCFRGSIDDWIPVGGPGTLAAQVRQFVKHLGRESFCELM